MIMLQLRLAEGSTAIRRRAGPEYRRTKNVRAGGGGRLASAGFFDVALHYVNASINCECAGEQIGVRRGLGWSQTPARAAVEVSTFERRNRCGIERLFLFTYLLSHGFPICQA